MSGRMRQRARGARLGTVAVLVLLPLLTMGLPVQAASTATVVSTDALNIRSCPGMQCAVLVSARLGETVLLTGEAQNGFLPVQYRGYTGWAYNLYLAVLGAPVPRLVQGEPGCRRVALIFDIGITDAPDLGILDTLTSQNVPATMFVMGWWARAYPDYVARIAAAGFPIGSHGDQRQEMTARSDAQIVHDLGATAAAIHAATGALPGPWFTPYAAASDDRVRALVASQGYLPVGFRVPAADYGADATPDSVWARVVPNIVDGAIVEFHLDGPASSTSTGVALPWIIGDLRAQGFQFVTIPQMADPCQPAVSATSTATATATATATSASSAA